MTSAAAGGFEEGEMSLIPARSMFWKLFIPVSLVMVASAIGAAAILPALIQRTAERDAIEAGQETAQQFKALRKYYTDNVVAKVLAKTSLAVSFDHLSNPNTVPLPATMILDMSTLLRQNGTVLKLYSPYPFPQPARPRARQVRRRCLGIFSKKSGPAVLAGGGGRR